MKKRTQFSSFSDSRIRPAASGSEELRPHRGTTEGTSTERSRLAPPSSFQGWIPFQAMTEKNYVEMRPLHCFCKGHLKGFVKSLE